MADPLRPNPFQPIQNFSATEMPGQRRPNQPPKCSEVQADKQLLTAPRHHESVTKKPRELTAHSITTEKTTAHSGHFKSHGKKMYDQQSARPSSQPARTRPNLLNNGSKATSVATVKNLFAPLSVSISAHSGYERRQPSVNLQRDSHSLSGKAESNTSNRTLLAASGQTNPARTISQKARISGRELPTRPRPSKPGGYENKLQEMEQRICQRKAEFKIKEGAANKEFVVGIDQPFKKNLEPFWQRSSATTLTPPPVPSCARQLPANCPNAPGITIQSTCKVLHTPENIAPTIELAVEEHIKCATINVGKSLQSLRKALLDVYKQLSWRATSTWNAAMAFNSSQGSLDMLAAQYQAKNIGSLPPADIGKFRDDVQKCVHKFIEATKEIKSDRKKLVTLAIDISMSPADEPDRTGNT